MARSEEELRIELDRETTERFKKLEAELEKAKQEAANCRNAERILNGFI
jgi:hypothetical protein